MEYALPLSPVAQKCVQVACERDRYTWKSPTKGQFFLSRSRSQTSVFLLPSAENEAEEVAYL